jgi:flavodoxin
MKIPKVPKIIKKAGILVIVIIVISLAAAGIVGLDLLSNLATGSEKLTPFGNPTENALVVYDPGVTGAAKEAATKIAGNLQSRGFDVTLAGVKSTAAADVAGYDVIVAGGPIYAGKVGNSIYSYLDDLQAPDNAKVGAFATGGSRSGDKEETVFPAAADLKAVVLLFPGDSVNQVCADFVTELLQ